MDELVYYTRRDIDSGKAEVWVFREKCSCGKFPRKPKLRASEYVCDCGKSHPKDSYEEKLIANIVYTCPKCRHSGEKQVPFKRKKIKGVDTLRFQCDKCGADIDVTKKMK